MLDNPCMQILPKFVRSEHTVGSQMRAVNSFDSGPPHEFGCSEALDECTILDVNMCSGSGRMEKRTVEAQASGGQGHCINGVSCLIVHCHVAQERCCRRCVQEPGHEGLMSKLKRTYHRDNTYGLTTTSLLRFDCRCFPHFVVVLRGIEVFAVL